MSATTPKAIEWVPRSKPSVAGRDIRLRLLHRLMRRAPRPEAEAHLGERSVPVRLKHLHHRLLDEAIEHRRNAERSSAA